MRNKNLRLLSEIDKHYLEKYYTDKSMNISDIAKISGHTRRTIRKYLDFYEIPKHKKHMPREYCERKSLSMKGRSSNALGVSWSHLNPNKGKTWEEIFDQNKYSTIDINRLKQKRSASMSARFKGSTPAIKSSRGKAFYRSDLNCYFRSTWEANFARILNYLNIPWEYESEKCRFRANGNSLTIDFYLPTFDLYIEVKGYFYKSSKEKFTDVLNSQKVIIKLVDVEVYDQLTKSYSLIIKEWEK